MPIQPEWTIPIPNASLPTWLFGSPTKPLSNKKVLVDANNPDTRYFSMETYRLWSKRIAIGLQKAGLERGDRLLLFSGNNMFFPPMMMGVLMAGGIFTAANPSYVARELIHQLRDSGAKFLLTADSALEMSLEAAEALGMSKERIFVFDEAPFDGEGSSRLGVRHWGHLIASANEAQDWCWDDPPDPKTATACLNYSSGTTGVPKGVEITHYNHVANAAQYNYKASLQPGYKEICENANWLCFLPMYHAMAQAYFVTVGPSRGVRTYIMPKFDFVQVLESIQKFKITQLALVPPVVVAFAKSPVTRKYDISSVKEVTCGAAPLGPEPSEEFNQLWKPGHMHIKQGWGMTEITCHAIICDPRTVNVKATVGCLNPNVQAKIMKDDESGEVERGQRGELWIKAPNVMKGYWNNPKATAETSTEDGWLKTGDICYVDEDGDFFIVDRKKELIKVKGNQVAPAELESVLLEHPDIADAGVVGVTIEGEELPRAYCVLQESSKCKPQDIAKWMESKVARHKRLAGGVVFVDAVPKNPSGKIMRKFLRERANKEVGDRPKESRL